MVKKLNYPEDVAKEIFPLVLEHIAALNAGVDAGIYKNEI